MSESRRKRRIVQRELIASVKKKMVAEMQAGESPDVVLQRYYHMAVNTLKNEVYALGERVDEVDSSDNG